MKITLLTSLALLFTHIASSQDIIHKTNGDSILVKVLKINSDEISYKKHSNLDGPDYIVSRSEVSVIVYENGSKDRFNETFDLPLTSDSSASDGDLEEEPEVFTVVEIMPQFPGGQDELYRFLGENMKYPTEAKDAGISGKVYVNFVVYEDGSVRDAKVLRGIGGGCDEEALRIVNLMPKWTAGTQRGKNVRVSYNLPFNFTLLEPTRKKKKR